MLKKLAFIMVLFLAPKLTWGYNFCAHKKWSSGDYSLLEKDRMPLTAYNMTVGRVWNHINNFGGWGGELGNGMLGYTWPGGAPVNNYYLWNSYFWIGTKVNGQAYVTAHDYPIGNWSPSSDPLVSPGPGKSVYDVVVTYDDFKDNPRNLPNSHLGVKVTVRAMQWPHSPYKDMVAYEVYIIYDSSQCDIPEHGDELDSVMVGIVFDADVCGADQSDPHIDDLVSYDGWTAGEWGPDKVHGWELQKDSVTLLPDSFSLERDGIPDYYVIWGDEPGEHVAAGDSLYLFPRNMSYIYDGDNPNVPGDDTGEDGKCPGYIGGAWIYAPSTPDDSVDGDKRFVRPHAHQWWNWESDPATDDDRYRYLIGDHPSTRPYRFALHPLDFGASPFDYRFLLSIGPFTIRDINSGGDTLKLVFIGGVGIGLNGGPDTYWSGGKFIHGLRHVIDWGIKAYYSGDSGDPAHPTPPVFGLDDTHWGIPIPPPAPLLVYSATAKGVQLTWDDTPERTPDPKKGYVDFSKYIIYKAQFVPQNWVPVDTITAVNGEYRHSYVDTTVIPGMPYYYAVESVDEDGLGSGKVNYKKDEDGNPVPVVIATASQSDLDKVKVVPNPYFGSAIWTATELADKVEFQNLPPSCVIKIYTLSGDLVKVIEHKNGTGSEAWNLLNKDGQKVVSGVYIYKVETDNGYKIGKMMILK